MFIISGFLLGLSTGIFCLSLCAPIYVPLVMAEKRSKTQTFWILGKFSLGRLIAYLIFGAAVGYLGEKIENQYINWFVSVGLIFLALLIVSYSIGLIKKHHSKICSVFSKIRIAFILGFLTGINICPPFLIALSYGFKLGNIGRSILFFLMFFIATSLYIIPLTFLGFLGKFKNIRSIAQVAGVIVGIIFLINGVRALF